MINVFLELQRLRTNLRSKGLDEEVVELLVNKAESEIMNALQERMDSAMDLAVQSGVQKDSADFINELRPNPGAFMLDTESGSTDFSEPPYPMLDRLLARGAKPMKDGSGIYKIIPVGKPSNNPKPAIHTNIFDAQKAVYAERYESSVSQYNRVAPKSSKVHFRTATSKQNRATQWVMPAKEKDFTEDLAEINSMLGSDHDEIVMSVIRSYEEDF